MSRRSLMRITTSRLFCICLLLSVNSVTSAQTLIPFETWQKSRSGWESDPTEVAYMVFRCGALLDRIGRVFIENGATPEHRTNGQGLVQRADRLLATGAALSLSTGLDETRLLERAKAFFDIYIRQIVENRRLHNDMFEGWVGEDFQFCIGRYKFMEELGKRISGPKD